MDGRIDGGVDGWMDGWMEGWIYERTNEWMDNSIDKMGGFRGSPVLNFLIFLIFLNFLDFLNYIQTCLFDECLKQFHIFHVFLMES